MRPKFLLLSAFSLKRTLCPKIWASYCSAEYCPRRQKKHFRVTCVRHKTSFKLPIKMLNNIKMQNVVSPLLLFSLDLPNLRQGQGAWICIILFTRVFIPPRFSSPFWGYLRVLNSVYFFYCAFKHRIMSLCLKRVGSGYYKSRLITTKQNKPSFVSFLVFTGCRERTAHFDARHVLKQCPAKECSQFTGSCECC